MIADTFIERRRRLNALGKIYDEIAAWGRDAKCVSRIRSAINPFADLVVIGEAAGPDTLRRSGVNYFRLDGCLGKSGNNLEEILRSVGLTLFPPQEVTLRSGAVIEGGHREARQTVYCTDLCPEYPGARASTPANVGRRKPSRDRVRDALKHGFLMRELRVVQPKVILLLGVEAYRAFYTHFLKTQVISTLQAVIDNLDRNVATYRGAIVIPFLHPSPASPSFQAWFKRFKRAPDANALLDCIRRARTKHEVTSPS